MNHRAVIKESTRLMEEFFSARDGVLERAIQGGVQALLAGGKILVFGNGGSAAEAQHFAAEMVNRFKKTRRALRVISLTTDTSNLTSIANDSAFAAVFSRQVEALADQGDVALALSTSGNSPNVVKALKTARRKKMVTIGLTGKGGGKMAPLCDHLLDVPSSDTARIQEIHLVILHILAQEIENRLA